MNSAVKRSRSGRVSEDIIDAVEKYIDSESGTQPRQDEEIRDYLNGLPDASYENVGRRDVILARVELGIPPYHLRFED